jgi:protein-disulfide isomerase
MVPSAKSATKPLPGAITVRIAARLRLLVFRVVAILSKYGVALTCVAVLFVEAAGRFHVGSDSALPRQVQQLQTAQSVLMAQQKSLSKQIAELRTSQRGVGANPASGQQRRVPTEAISLLGAEIRGSETAKVAIIEFSDFQCAFCQRFAQTTLPVIEERYISTGQVKLQFRNLPIPQLHPQALLAAEAGECAARQNGFWSMHDALFANPKDLSDASLLKRAADLGLAMPRFTECLHGNSAFRVRKDVELASSLGLNGTPTFFIGLVRPNNTVLVSQRIDGTQDFEAFRAVIDPLLAAHGK